VIITDRRIGRFYIHLSTLNRNPAMLRQLFAQCIVLKAEISYERDAIEYHAICDQFRQINIAESAPVYAADFHSENGFIGFRAEPV
jgi:hypothetical protein